MTRTLLLAASLLTATNVSAAVKTQDVTYTHDGVTFKGQFAWDDSIQGKRPGVLVVHEWWGLNQDARNRAAMLASMGYIAFACDMYGEGKVTEHPAEAGKMAGEVRKNLGTWIGRAKASLELLAKHEACDPKKLAAIGYCFGGSTSLQIAYSGADVAAVVSFHGALPVPTEEQVKGIKAKILICHGAMDSFIPEEVIQKTRAALDAGGANYQMVYYGGAVHSFTVKDAGKAGVKGLAYNADADRRSWAHMKMLFDEVFAK